jgi:hypothetical protein
MDEADELARELDIYRFPVFGRIVELMIKGHPDWLPPDDANH